MIIAACLLLSKELLWNKYNMHITLYTVKSCNIIYALFFIYAFKFCDETFTAVSFLNKKYETQNHMAFWLNTSL